MAFNDVQPGLIEGDNIDPRINEKVNPGGGDKEPHKGGGHEGGGEGNEDNYLTIRLRNVLHQAYDGRIGMIWPKNPNPDSHVKIGRSFNI